MSRYAAANNVPESLVRRIIRRESRGNPRAVRKGNYGLMQIRLGTARAMGYRGGARGLLDAETNMTYAVKYLAGAYRAAGGNADRAVHYYAAGYYYAAKRKGLLDRHSANPIGAFAEAAAGGGSVRGAKHAGKIELTNDGEAHPGQRSQLVLTAVRPAHRRSRCLLRVPALAPAGRGCAAARSRPRARTP